MEDSDKGLESTGESNRAAESKAAGRIDLQYTQPDGRVLRLSLMQFGNFSSQYDTRKRIWMSEGDAVSNTRPPQGFHIRLAYDEFKRVLTIAVGNYMFTAPSTHMHAGVFNNGRALEIGFLQDVEGHTDIVGDQYLIRRNSRLKLSL